MLELKLQKLLTLAELFAKGARYNFIPVTTSSLGNSIHKSQQAASKHLLVNRGPDLQEYGFATGARV